MSRAADALRLERAKLSAEQTAGSDALYESIYVSVEEGMARRGVDIKVLELDKDVLADVSQRLKRDGWLPTWQPIASQYSRTAVGGYLLMLAPSDAAYIEAGAVGFTGVRGQGDAH